MGEYVTVYLTTEELNKVKELSEFYGEESRSRILKLALAKLHKKLEQDVEEEGEDSDLAGIQKSRI
jgi:hypothetical protein